ncbi:MAG TPA: riboflavin synthase [Solirubrobacteraceae bacterium]|nr:riboflavin synthase [Solirubrobacteraceae bacterium]
MFTGLVSELGTVESIERDERGAMLHVAAGLAGELGEGDSVAVNGVCLTATRVSPRGFDTQAMNETLRRSSLDSLESGSRVNLELPLRAGDRLGGHVVQGHVDGTATVRALHEEGFSRVLELGCAPGLLRYVVLKGSIAVDGVSLTVSALGEDGFSVSLIPETLTRTTLGTVAEGDCVNVEVDVLAKHLERLTAVRA